MIVPALCGLLGLIAADAGAAVADAEVLRRAEAAFREGEGATATEAEASYRRAGEGYETLRARGYANADLCRNEGRAYYLAGDLPRAVLAFRRGLHLRPGDRDLRNALAFARTQVVLPADRFGAPPASVWPLWLPLPPPWLLLGLTLLAWWFACAGVTRWLMTRRRHLLYYSLTAAAAAVMVGLVFTVGAERLRWESAHPAVVIAKDDTVLRKGNGLTYPPRHASPLGPGTEASLLFRRGDWLQIQLAGGEIGWVPHSAALVAE